MEAAGAEQMLAESDLSGTITAEYIYFNGARVGKRVPSTGAIYYYLSDRLGTARVITNATGTVVAESDYYPYGGERVVTADTSGNTYKFTGHERDSETNLDHTEYRQYSSNTGRWLSADAVKGKAENPQTWNRRYKLARRRGTTRPPYRPPPWVGSRRSTFQN
ncbi:MAG: hypothetical protein HYX72_09510 [Acidobacteria bacterium]|nr:hypothetical protein [Acidobacteriota bacterium]